MNQIFLQINLDGQRNIFHGFVVLLPAEEAIKGLMKRFVRPS